MKLDDMLPYRTAAFGLGLGLWAQGVIAAPSGIMQEYCSGENTGSEFSPENSIYNSMGSCSETCRAEYAFAVVQGKNCWCSNYIPSQQDSTSMCESSCPGYPDDYCGNPGGSMYGYIPLDKKPSGTAGAQSSRPQSTPQPQSSRPPPPQTSSPPSSAPAPESSYTPESSSAPAPAYSSSAPAPASSSSESSTSTHSPTHAREVTPVVHTSVITRSGNVVTQTVTSTPVVIAPGAPDSAETPVRRTGLSGGAIAGIVIGTLLGVAALILAAFLLWRRKKNSRDTEGQPGATRPKRATSVLSRTGLLSRGRAPSMSDNTYENDGFVGGNSVRHSMIFGAGASVEPSSPLAGSQDDVSQRRHSRPMVYDQRLNPSALFANPEANGSRASMQDQQDYSRPLGIANPDYRASFDSR